MQKLALQISKIFPEYPGIAVQQSNLFDPKRLGYFLLALVQFCALLFITSSYSIEKPSGIIEFTPFIIGAFVIYSFTPFRFRPCVLFLICVALIYSAFGLFIGSLLIAIGLSLILICHLPVKFWIRVLMILCIAFGLFVLRVDLLNFPRPTLVVMYMAPMFMFRLVIYLYEIKHGLVPVSKWQSVSYFFMFPNILFLFFPIVDYKTYIKTYYSLPEKDAWQKGIRWMLRGIIHIMCYRLLCFNFLITPADVTDIMSLLQYIVINYMLILRLSGIFHFIVGLLCMFGMNLPPVFNNYFIATSFVDLWRRINIYWREFVLKIFFYPIMFFLRKRISRYVLPVTMMTVFVITWLLHSYQLFWITGKIPIKLVDAGFWIVIGICITTNSVLIEKENLSEAPAKKETGKFKKYLMTIMKIQGMILFMSVMWCLWNSKNLEDWGFVMSKGLVFSQQQLLEIIIAIVVITVGGILVQAFLDREKIKGLINIKPQDTLFLTLPSIFILSALSFKTVQSHLPVKIRTIMGSFANAAPNIIEKKDADVGYYDRLIEGDEDMTIGLGGKTFKKKLKVSPYNQAYILSDGIINRIMKPNLNIKGLDHDFASNSFGIRDKSYALVKPDSTCRIALLGGSYEMGSGVSNNQVFEAITEDRLNQEHVDSNYRSIEIFNFAAGGYYLMDHVELINNTVFKYNPDVVLYVAHSEERGKTMKNITNLIKRKADLKYPFLKFIQQVSGVKSYMSEYQIKELLTPYIDCLIEWSYYQVAINCRKHHATPVWAYLMLTTTEQVDMEEYETMKGFAQKFGFVTLDLRNVYGDVERSKIQISEWNTHPNVLGQKMIADEFYLEIMKHKKAIFRK